MTITEIVQTATAAAAWLALALGGYNAWVAKRSNKARLLLALKRNMMIGTPDLRVFNDSGFPVLIEHYGVNYFDGTARKIEPRGPHIDSQISSKKFINFSLGSEVGNRIEAGEVKSLTATTVCGVVCTQPLPPNTRSW